MNNLLAHHECETHCAHCGSELSQDQLMRKLQFCCTGCETVYQTIHSLGLGSYYDLRGSSRPALRGEITPLEHHRYADDPLFRKTYCSDAGDEKWRMTIDLQGIHCAACIWLLERMPAIVPHIYEARVRFADSQLDIVFGDECSCAVILSEIERLGYRGKPLQPDATEVTRSRRGDLVRIGVAAVCALNTMMLAVSLYQGDHSGIDRNYQHLLQWYSLALTIPVVCYAAVPFYRTALGGIRAGILHIDLPIVLALLGAFVVSVYNTVFSRSDVYYDSVSTVVFLLLAARYFQNRVVAKMAGRGALLAALVPLKARLISADGTERWVYSGSVAPGDTLSFVSGDTISADGSVTNGSGLVTLASLTGESRPLKLSPGDSVYAGTALVEGAVTVRVEAVGAATRIGKLMLDVIRSASQRSSIQLFLDRHSRVFTAVVLIGALGTCLFWGTVSSRLAIERTIAFLLVACPCVLALATPIVFSTALIRAARHGILFRSTEVIERLAAIERVIFDKTGTLTTGQMQVQRIWSREKQWSTCYEDLDPGIPDLILAMESNIDHPAAFAFRGYFNRKNTQAALHGWTRTVIAGSGIELTNSNGESAKLGSPDWDEIRNHLSTEVQSAIEKESASGATIITFLSPAGDALLFSISDRLREESQGIVARLRQLGLPCSILSGDLGETTRAIGRELGIPPQDCFAPRNPEEKHAHMAGKVTEHATAMVGDGINDAAALTAATVGIGMVGGAESSLRVADMYLCAGNLTQLVDAIRGARRVMHSVRLSLAISAAYNICGSIAAFSGYIGPLEAAILMPLSSISSIVLAATRKNFQGQ